MVIISASRRVEVPVHELHHLLRCGGQNCQEGGRGVGVYSVVNMVTVESSKGTYERTKFGVTEPKVTCSGITGDAGS